MLTPAGQADNDHTCTMHAICMQQVTLLKKPANDSCPAWYTGRDGTAIHWSCQPQLQGFPAKCVAVQGFAHPEIADHMPSEGYTQGTGS